MSIQEKPLDGFKAIIFNGETIGTFILRITAPKGIKITQQNKNALSFLAQSDHSIKGKDYSFELNKIVRRINIVFPDTPGAFVLYVRGPIVIPGRKIDKSTPNIKVKALEEKPILVKGFDTILNKYSRTQTLIPFTFSKYSSSKNHLSVDILFLIHQKVGERVLDPNEINFYFDLGFDSGGANLLKQDKAYKLFLYAEYDTGEDVLPPNQVKDMYHLYEFNIEFSKESLETSQNKFIRMIEVGKTQAVIITQNPETTRGTETTVQEGG